MQVIGGIGDFTHLLERGTQSEPLFVAIETNAVHLIDLFAVADMGCRQLMEMAPKSGAESVPRYEYFGQVARPHCEDVRIA